MKLFDKWQSVTEAYNSFNGEYKILAKEVSFFLEYLTQTNDSFYNAVLKMFNSDSGGFSILVKEAESVDDFPLVFKFKNINDDKDEWEFIVRDKQEENKTMLQYLKSIQHEDKDHALIKQNAEKAGVSTDAMLIVEYLIVELLKNGGFDD